jgi:hypothetical protein
MLSRYLNGRDLVKPRETSSVVAFRFLTLYLRNTRLERCRATTVCCLTAGCVSVCVCGCMVCNGIDMRTVYRQIFRFRDGVLIAGALFAGSCFSLLCCGRWKKRCGWPRNYSRNVIVSRNFSCDLQFDISSVRSYQNLK